MILQDSRARKYHAGGVGGEFGNFETYAWGGKSSAKLGIKLLTAEDCLTACTRV